MKSKKIQKIINNIIFDTVNDDLEWTNLLNKYGLSNLYNSSSWGKYKRKKGWLISKIIIRSKTDNKKIAFLLLQKKKIGIFNFYVCQGGFFTLENNEEFIYSCLHSLVKQFIKMGSRDIFFLHNFREVEDVNTQAILRFGFKPRLESNMYSFYLNLKKENNFSIDKLHKNWRHNLKRALNNNRLSIKHHKEVEDRIYALSELKKMYELLTLRKSFRPGVDIDQISQILINDQRFIILSAIYDDQIAAIRIGYQSANDIIDFLAASNNLAIKTYANYLLVWSLIEKANNLNLDGFEFGGIDPYSNQGVYLFKRGIGAELSINGPLWIYHKSPIVRKIIGIFN